jgi:hypothetical protein
MKKIIPYIILFALLPMASMCQCTLTHEGILSAEVTGSSVLIKNDSVCRNCGSLYSMNVSTKGNDTIIWMQNDTGAIAYCDCNFNYSITIDSLHPGIYFAKVYYSTPDNDTNYVGTVTFTITVLNSFVTPKLTSQYKSSCYYVNVPYEEASVHVDLITYPNPSHDYLKVTSALEGEKLFRIYDINNRCVKVFSSNEQEKTIDISDLPNSIYNISVETKGKIVYTRFCKY